MATVRIAVKYTNREYLRIYDISGDAEFEVVKDAVKDTGAKYDGGFGRKWWVARKAGLDTLKAAGYTITNADFEIDAPRHGVVFIATGETVAHVEWRRLVNTYLGGIEPRLRDEDWDRLARYRDELQAAYNKSDEALRPVILRIRKEARHPVIVED